MCTKRTQARTHATRSHLVGEDFSVLPEARLQLQLLRHLCELLRDKLGDCARTHKHTIRWHLQQHFLATHFSTEELINEWLKWFIAQGMSQTANDNHILWSKNSKYSLTIAQLWSFFAFLCFILNVLPLYWRGSRNLRENIFQVTQILFMWLEIARSKEKCGVFLFFSICVKWPFKYHQAFGWTRQEIETWKTVWWFSTILFF